MEGLCQSCLPGVYPEVELGANHICNMLRCRSGHLLHRPSPGQLGNVELSHYVKSYGILEKLKLKNNIVSPNVCTVFKMFTWKLAIPIFSLRTQSLVRLQVTHTGKWHDFEKIALLLNSK